MCMLYVFIIFLQILIDKIRKKSLLPIFIYINKKKKSKKQIDMNRI